MMLIKRSLCWVIVLVLAACGNSTYRSSSMAALASTRASESALVSTARRPILLVPGWGYKLTEKIVPDDAWANYIQWLVADGYQESDIHIITYPYTLDLDTIKSVMIPQINAVMAQYPADTQFDVMGHSLGGFTSLWAIMEGGFAGRVKKFISLSGIPQGWDSWYCAMNICGTADKQLTPFRNAFVLSFLNQYATEIHALQKCSLYSPADEFVRPYDAGRFDDGNNVEVPHMLHMETIWLKKFYDVMRSNCYADES